MPHLTSTGRRRAGTGAARTGFGVPGYAHPLLAPAEWAELTRPGTPLHWAVLNVADGPGTRPDPHCLEAAGRLTNAGVRVLGHLDLKRGAYSFADLVCDAQRYVDWYRVGGFYLDRAPGDRSDLAGVRRLTATLEAVLDGGHVVLGHGAHPYAGYAEAADQLVTYSGTWSEYRWSQAPQWTAGYSPEHFVHWVHGVPRTHLDEAMRIARWQGAGTIFFTDRSGPGGAGEAFAGLPGYWDEIVSLVGPGISE
ncbi:spherulation-specific family 4 protein [Streptomyces sp. 8L]|uniref:spherulation-specific family 4 protein n=1 Tax=Streptomyces sp. 8L TaxID=2877242 RepID=UPI001CD740C7|nr:spherulation-specific family 4 protein [Streptomyces sp. 8L]MCA1221065.1 spherulation-specific family 4 protein [Streptomyces sp. 8L]